MPELPEVEVLTRHLKPRLIGRRIDSVKILRDGLIEERSPRSFSARLRTRQIVDVRRRAKLLRLDLDDGSHWLVHQKMTGRLAWHRQRPDPSPHLLALFGLDRGVLSFTDLRRFGRMWWLPPGEVQSHFERLGPEPLDGEWTVDRFHDDLARRTIAIKQALLDPRLVAGIGNIYASESLHRARIHPARPAASLTRAEASRLRRAVRAVLKRAIALGSTVLPTGDDVRPVYYHGGDSEPLVADEFRVYDREHLPCPACGTPIERLRQGQRSTYFCPACQEGS
ncbi:MAG: bifunctional DNA-formamidopyrimidine glycosylase/DNA-(apurinic or apyrimidinic site) lyase [Planctomycetota bacterium]